MSTGRITVTLPSQQVRQLHEMTDNVSGFVAEAVADRLRLELLRQDLSVYQAEHGAFTAAERKQARQDLTPWTPPATMAA